MTLDDMEKLAAACRDSLVAETVTLAEFVLAVMSVIRAAEAWHRVNTGMHTNGPQHMLALRDADRALKQAIDAMRAGMKEG